MSNKRRFKIINDTIRPLKLNSKGQDTRPNRDRTGSAVQFYIGEGPNAKLVTIYQNKSTIVDEVSDQILSLHKKGRIIIESINDITDELRNFSIKPDINAARPAGSNEVFRSSKVDAPYEARAVPADVRARAVPSGTESHEEKLVNPDGEPNFLAKAPRGGLKKKVELPVVDKPEVE